MDLFTDIVLVFSCTDLLLQIPWAVFAIDHQHLSGRIKSCIDPTHEKYPDHHYDKIDACHLEQIVYIPAKLPVTDQCQLKIGDKIHTEHRQDLGIKHFKHPEISYLDPSVKLIEKKQKQGILRNDHIVSSVPVVPQHILFKMMIPHICKNADLDRHDQSRSQKHEQMLVFFSFFQGLPP